MKQDERKMAGCAFPWRPEGNEPMHIAPIKRDEDGRPPRVMVKATAGPSGQVGGRPESGKGRLPLVEEWNLGVERFQLSLSAALFDARTGIRRSGKQL